MLTYKDCEKMFDGRNSHRESRRLGNNTYLRRTSPVEFAVRYHDTDMLVIRADGTYLYDAGGWYTATTKMRLNEYGPAQITQRNRRWYFSVDQIEYEYQDGMTVDTRTDPTRVEGAPVFSSIKEKQDNRLKRRAHTYATKYVDKFLRQELPKPDAGDCLICRLFDTSSGKPRTDASHIQSHLDEKYYVPSLLLAAIRRFPVSPIANSIVHGIWGNTTDEQKKAMGLMDKIDWSRGYMSIVQHQLHKSIYRWCLVSLGFAA